jgi:HPt (histidine-containing phosphotransfer) domain-containing protein
MAISSVPVRGKDTGSMAEAIRIPDALIENYLKRRIEEVKLLENALADDDYSVLFRIGHQLKGNGMMFGFPVISEIGSKIEKGSLVRNKAEMSMMIDEYRNSLDQIIKNQQRHV